jgi:hypothetical protein
LSQLQWKLILLLSLPGPLIGLLTVYGVIPFGNDRWYWLAISVVGAIVIARRVEGKAFFHGALVGVILGASSKLIQGVFSRTYIAHNPELLDRFGDMNVPELRYFLLMLVPFVGVANALILGLMSHFAHRAMPKARNG